MNFLDDDDLSKRLGTPPFLAPEVVAEYTTDFTPTVSSDTLSAPQGLTSSQLSHPERRRVTHAVDIWALGATLFCLLFGHTPFSTNDGEYVLYNIICKSEWEPELTMGSDQVLVPPRPWRCENATDEGTLAMNLLDGLLQKDVNARITLPAIKVQYLHSLIIFIHIDIK
jgi:SNF1-activating kinase 1